ncbi:MAG: ABC transporter ATP-binding protein [Pirellulaceae bacterium]|nr:ABC transporter ATP-binding protein [Pirellulaceae bacterium]
MRDISNDRIDRASFRDVFSNGIWALRLAWSASPSIVAITLFVGLLRSLVPVVMIVCVRGLVNDFQAGVDVSGSMHWLMLLPIVIFGGAMASNLGTYVAVRLRDEMDLAINLGLFAQASRLDLSFFEDPANQDMMSRARENSAHHCELLVNDASEFLRNGFQLIFLSGLVFAMDPITAIVLAGLAIPFAISQFRMSILRYLYHHRRATKVRWNAYFISKLMNHIWIPEVKSYNLSPLFIRRFREISQAFCDENRRFQGRFFVIESVFAAIFTIALAALGYHVISQAIAGKIAPGNVAALMLAAERLYTTVSQQIRVFSRLVNSSLLVSNLQKFQNAKPTFPKQGGLTLANPEGAIDFREVSFAYPGCEMPILHSVSLSIEPGEVVAIVGQNGAGKTTLIKLLSGLYSPNSGAIYFDGHDVEELSERCLQTNIASVMQSFAQYEGTAAENIAFGDWKHLLDDQAAVREIAERVGVHEMIESLPHGYDTVLGRTFGEVTLSGGQWQMLAIARALASKAKVVVLDEPTSALDPKTEYEMFGRFRQLVEGRTAIIISHRFSTVRMADRILVLDEGRVVENGSHAELISSAGVYAQLYELHQQILDGSNV